MTVAASFDDLMALGKAELQLRRPDLDASEGDITDLILAAAAAMGDKNEGTAARLFAATFVDTAQGQDLTILADDHWGIVRQAATAALVTLTFHRTTSGAGAGTIPSGTVVATLIDALGNRLQFSTNANVTYGALETGNKTVAATCTTTGTTGNVAAAALTVLLSTLFDASVTVTNVTRAAGGAETESDESLRERIRTFPSTLRRGTLAALEYGARTVPGVATATASEGPTGLVTVYVADSSGNSNAELNEAVEFELENWRAAGTVISVGSGIVLSVDVDVRAGLTVAAGYDVAANVTLLQAAVSNRMAKLKIGETLYLSALKAAIIAVAPNKILDVDFAAPLANIAPTENQVIRAGSITFV